MKKIQDISALLFILCLVVLTGVAVGGIWDFFGDDVVWKSFQTIGLLAVASAIIIFAGRMMDSKKEDAMGQQMVELPNPIFKSLRHMTVVVLVLSIVLMAVVGVLSIWEVIGGEAVGKSMATMATVAFSSFLVVVVALVREGHELLHKKINGVGWLVGLVLVWVVGSIVLWFLSLLGSF